MTRYSVQLRDRIFVKCYGFLSFATNTGKNIVKKISKNISSKYRQKSLDHAKKSATDALKTASVQKTAEATGDLIGKKNDRNTKVLQISPQNNSETVTNEHDKKIPKERYISSEEWQKTIGDLRLIK